MPDWNIVRENAAKQLKACVLAGETDVILNLLPRKHILALAQDWQEGKE